MNEIKTIRITKNRGWRGLAELYCMDKDRNRVTEVVFSFSQNVWSDMLDGYIVIQDETYYYVLELESTDYLPSRDQQRSVLIKGVEVNVSKTYAYTKADWRKDASGAHGSAIYDFIMNKNNHTTSDWNYIGIRVIPAI